MRRILPFLVLVSLACDTRVPAQEVADYSQPAHWVSGTRLDGSVRTMHGAGTALIAIDGSRMLRRVDFSDPEHPQILPPIAMPEGASGIVGQSDAYFYVAGDTTLYVLDRESLDIVATMPFGHVIQVTIDGDRAAVVMDRDPDLAIVDATDPLAFVVQSTPDVHFPSQAVFWGDFLAVAPWSDCFGAALLDVSDPTNPIELAELGDIPCDELYAFEHVAGVVAADALYTITERHNYAHVSPESYHSWITRWDLSDPLHPVAGATADLLLDDAGAVRAPTLQGYQLMTIVGNMLVTMDLSDPELATGNLEILCPGSPIGWISINNLYIFGGFRGDVDVFSLPHEDAAVASLAAGRSVIDAVLTDTRLSNLAKGTIFGDEVTIFHCQGMNDPHEPAELLEVYPNYTVYRCAASTHIGVYSQWAAAGPVLRSFEFDTVPPLTSVIQGFGSEIVFVSDSVGAIATNEGLRIADVSDPNGFIDLAMTGPPLLRVGQVAGSSPIDIVTLTDAQDLELWQLDDSAQPVRLATVTGPFRDLVRMHGKGGPLAAAMLPEHDAWTRGTMQLIDCTDPAQPRFAGAVDLPSLAVAGWLEYDTLYIACGDGGLVVLDLTDLDAPRIRGGQVLGRVMDVRQRNDQLWAVGRNLVILPIDVSTAVELELASFDLAVQDGGVDVRWSRLAGPRTAEFRLSRLDDGGAVRDISVVEIGPNEWMARDTSPGAGPHTYELEYRWVPGGEWTFAAQKDVSVPAATPRLFPPAPNPANPAVSLRFDVAQPTHVSLGVYDLAGRCLRQLTSATYDVGTYSVTWDGRDDQSRAVASGAYLARLESEGRVCTRKLTLAR